jgi:GAF domain-containing protein
LCLPLVKQTRLAGVLYLENNLSSHVFTPARIAVLQLLASQAAISLENVQAQEELQRRETDLRKAQAELAHVTRVTTMGELAASIAHEVSQPIAGVMLNGTSCIRWLDRINEDSAKPRRGP